MERSTNHALKNKRSPNLDLTIFELLKQGKNPAKICSILNISKQKVGYYTTKFQREGRIRNIGYGTWEIITDELKEVQIKGKGRSSRLKDNRGHGFQVKLKLNRISKWDSTRRKEFLNKKDIPHKNNNPYKTTQSFQKAGNTVWLSDRSIVIYWNKFKHYYGHEAKKQCKKYFLYDLIQVFKSLESFFNVSFKRNGKYEFKISKQHYGKIKNDLAKQYARNGKRLYLYDQKGLWLIIDDSPSADGFGFKEIETVHPDTADDDMDRVVNPFFNQLKDLTQKNIKVMPEDTLNRFKAHEGKINTNKEEFYQAMSLMAKNYVSHVSLVKENKRVMNAVNKLLNTLNKKFGSKK